MKELFFIIMLLVSSVNTMVPEKEIEQKQEFCFMCDEEIPACDGRYSYDPDHLICIHCYFYKAPKDINNVAPIYIPKNGTSLI